MVTARIEAVRVSDCEWLDMPPISTAVTAIEEAIVLRKARRLEADVRAGLSTAAGRAAARDMFKRRRPNILSLRKRSNAFCPMWSDCWVVTRQTSSMLSLAVGFDSR